jgi:hypothetical protein
MTRLRGSRDTASNGNRCFIGEILVCEEGTV